MSKLPSFFKPMLATLVDDPFDSSDWIFEIKWDGYRALAFIDKSVEIYSRNHQFFNQKFKPIVEELRRIKHSAILDGEIVILDEEGRSQFQLMQNYQRTQKGELFYCVFDLLYLDGNDLRDMPLIQRKEMLEDLLKKAKLPRVKFSDHIEDRGIAFFQEAKKKQLEGMIAKKKDSLYVSKRSREWLKIKCHMRQEVVIGGFTESRGSRKYFGALLLGVYDDKKEFVYAGHVGGGFDAALLKDVYQKMEPLEQDQCPFKKVPKTNTPARWLKPKLVCEVSFEEWTNDGRMRQPIFKGLRIDKKAKEVKREHILKP